MATLDERLKALQKKKAEVDARKEKKKQIEVHRAAIRKLTGKGKGGERNGDR